MDFLNMSALSLAQKIKNKEITIKAVLDSVYKRIEENDPKYNLFISLCKEEAYKRAEEIQNRIDKGEEISYLAGVPVGIKDNICSKNIKTTCGSKMLESFVPPYNAHAVDLIEKAGMIVVGKLNMDEFAMGSTTETSYFGTTLNPFDEKRVSGGSSGASAAAVALGIVPLSLGSDTGGSVREPASFCNVIGLKPTYGRVSRRGLVAFASSLDCIGVIGNFAEDCKALLKIISVEDEKDSTFLTPDVENSEEKHEFNFKNKKIAVLSELLGDETQADVNFCVHEAAEILKLGGAEVSDISMPILKYAVPAYYIIACAEASSNLSRYDGIRFGHRSENAQNLEELYIKSRSEGFGLEVKRRIMLGNFVLSAKSFESYYKKALKVKRLIQEEFFKVLSKYDFILSPVYPQTAPLCGESLEDPVKMYIGDICTVSANLTGLPAISIPCGFDKNNMPVGVQLTANKFCENELLDAAQEFKNMRAGGENNAV